MRMSSTIHKEKGNWKILYRLFPYLWRYRLRIGFGLAFLILAKLSSIGIPVLLKEIIDTFDPTTTQTIIYVPVMLLISYGLLRFATVLFNELRNLVFSRASIQTIHHISMELFHHLHRLSLRFHLDRKTGALSRDVERGTGAVASFLRMVVFSIVPTLFELIVVIGILWTRFEFSFALVTMVMITVYCLYTLIVTQWRTQFRIQMNTAESNANTRALDSLLNYETVKVFGNEQLESQRYDEKLQGWVSASIKSDRSLAFLDVGQGFIIAIGMTVLMLMAGQGVVAGSMTVGDFVMINAFLIQIYIPLNFMGSIYREMNHALIDMDKMFKLMDESPDIIQAKNAKPLELISGEIKFSNVEFYYQQDKPILKQINFSIPGGHTVAVVGPSGSGKSTLARLLLRFYDPIKGSIEIDNQNIQTLTLDSLRGAMGVVPQDTVLFNDTIGYNIRYGNQDASESDVEAAARIAQIHSFITQHPEGYDILVGERGLKLSGGEKQRVAIARTALKKARILIFDEATSSLDSRSEQAIQTALDDVSKNTTTLVIAHRLSTIVNADKILVLDQGTIVEQGRHTDLLAQNGLYHQMWTLQNEDSYERTPN